MKALTLALLAALASVGCGPPSPTDVFAANVDRVTSLTVTSQTLGIPSGNGVCATRSQRYDFTRHQLTVTACDAPRVVAAGPADTAALRSALRSVEVVPRSRCSGYDGVSTGVTLAFETGAPEALYALGASSCSGGPTTDLEITGASWGPAAQILARLAGK